MKNYHFNGFLTIKIFNFVIFCCFFDKSTFKFWWINHRLLDDGKIKNFIRTASWRWSNTLAILRFGQSSLLKAWGASTPYKGPWRLGQYKKSTEKSVVASSRRIVLWWSEVLLSSLKNVQILPWRRIC